MNHRIEESVIVHLALDEETGGWRIDGATLDGAALDSPYPNAPFNDECECGDRQACNAARNRAAAAGLPTGEELADLLREVLDARSHQPM